MRKIFIVLTALTLIISLAGCNGTSGGDTTATPDSQSTESTAQSGVPSESESDSDSVEGTESWNPGVMIDPSKEPTLTVICGNADVEAIASTCEWSWMNPDGTEGYITASGRHPLDIKEGLASLAISGEDNRMLMAFDSMEMPYEVVVKCWSYDKTEEEVDDKAFEITLTDPERQTDLWGGYSFELLDGDYVYEIIAKWEKNPEIPIGWGTVHYGFKTEKSQ